MPHIWASRSEVGGREEDTGMPGIDFVHVQMGIDDMVSEDPVDNHEDPCADLYIIWNKLPEHVTVNISINNNDYNAFEEITHTYNLYPIDPEIYNGISVGDFVKVIFKELEKGNIINPDPITGESKPLPENHDKILELLENPIIVHTEDYKSELK